MASSKGTVITTVVVYEVHSYLGSKEVVMDISSRDIDYAVANAPRKAISFRFAYVVRSSVRVGSRYQEVKSARLNISGTYFIGGTVCGLDKVHNSFALNAIEEVEGADSAVSCNDGLLRPFLSYKDHVIPMRG